MSPDPIVSICCISYNHAAFIEKCLDGFLKQVTDFSIEILVFDDASTDGTQNVIKEYANRDSRIITFLQTENQWNKRKYGLTEWLFPYAKGKYLAICEGDDYWTDPLKLQKQVDFLEENPECALCHHLHQQLKNGEFTPKTTAGTHKGKYDIYTIEKLTDRNFIYSSTIVFRRKVLEYLPSWFFELPVGDYPLFLFAGKLGNYGLLKEYMSVYRSHDGGLWSGRDPVEKAITLVKLLSKLQEGFSDMPVIRARLMRSMLHQAEIVRQSGSLAAEANLLQCQPAMAEVFLPVMEELVDLKAKAAATPAFKKIKRDFAMWLKWKLFS